MEVHITVVIDSVEPDADTQALAHAVKAIVKERFPFHDVLIDSVESA